jgi:hypothetical protein
MKLIADFHNFHRFRSVQWGALGVVCGATLEGYSKLGQWAPNLQAYVPGWALHIVTVLFFISPFASLLMRAIDQPNLSATPPHVPASNDFHQGDAP